MHVQHACLSVYMCAYVQSQNECDRSRGGTELPSCFSETNLTDQQSTCGALGAYLQVKMICMSLLAHALSLNLSHTAVRAIHMSKHTRIPIQSHKHMHVFSKHDFACASARAHEHTRTVCRTRAHAHTRKNSNTCPHFMQHRSLAHTLTPTHIYAHKRRAFVAASLIPRQGLRRHAQEDHSRVWLSEFASYERVMLWVTCSEILGFSSHQ
jgi:hypothetical protein